jgi:UDP-N-acetylglucosamine 1-carboxyvinyltransferase
VIDLAHFLTDSGACIEGAGSNRLVIEGKCQLHGSECTISPDRIETGTFMLAAAITRSCISMSPVIPSHLTCLIDKLLTAGCKIRQCNHDTFEVYKKFF